MNIEPQNKEPQNFEGRYLLYIKAERHAAQANPHFDIRYSLFDIRYLNHTVS